MTRDLNPGVFAFVMATGIVSTALHGDRLPVTSDVLLVAAIAGYAGLVVASGWRLLRWPRRMLADVVSPRGFAFLTFVAASNVLATRLAMGGWRWPAIALLAAGVLGWLLLGYGVPLGLIADPRRHPTLDQVNGTWFIWVVGTQSIAVAAATLAPAGPATVLAATAVVCWAIGLVLYLLLAAIGLARLLVRPVAAAELVPPYWVFMGAAAITILAGARLLALPGTLLSHSLLADVSLVLWSFCSWLIPLLVALGVWRHLVRRVSLRYETGLWSMVFPIGMYGVAGEQLGRATGIRWLAALGGGEAWVALAVWVVVFVAMLAAGGRWLRAGKRALRLDRPR
ncbi:tellurite resistance/C4-dicarboxylate transporter family protein [Amycolatopsis acididurans]|uniref:tellurite resistance/C4-dicarboxylate transporter family protein n=1 Tax=Amycolatopsis acididurans TaxID=2724524 RepID=UPI001B323E99|nr:tellurite resistance/C4-dicarboxylate transporter family protein [Amycolatopsis acididurans]